MRTDAQLRAFALKALRQSDGNPMPDGTLRHSLRLAFPNVTLTEGDLGVLIKGLESEGYLTGTTDGLSGGVVWLLTIKGTIAANNLP